MQSLVLQRFRMRAQNYGYRNIRIRKAGQDEDGQQLYTFSAIDPLIRQEVTCTYPESEFAVLLRFGKKWRNKLECYEEEVSSNA